METINANGMMLLKSRYLLQTGAKGELESPQQMFRRVANAVAKAELCYGNENQKLVWAEKFYKIMYKLLFLPNTPTLMNAGTEGQQLSACFVLPVEDSTEAIFTSLKTAALIQKSGGGTGFDFSNIRPKGAELAHGGKAAGPIAFMKLFDAMTENIRQSGMRRGANMGVLHISHPDIEEFINIKSTGSILQNFNISVGMTDSFMQAMALDLPWELIQPNTGERVGLISAKKLWLAIIGNARNHGDPGLLFLDEINRHNPTPALGKISCTNPCGEVPLLPYEACNLGSINLSKMVSLPYEKAAHIKWELLEDTVKTAIRFLDNVIDVNNYIVPEVNKITKGNRKIGLGIMGWADMLIRLGIPYASDEAVDLATDVMKFIKEKAWAASFELAIERGPFPNWENSNYFPMEPLRNATCTAIAPTGSIAIIAGVSTSIEPLFALAYEQRHIINESSFKQISTPILEYINAHGLYSDSLLERINEKGYLNDTSGLPQDVSALFKTALEIPIADHLRHQLAFQHFTDNAISKTINLPSTASITDVDWAYQMAWYGKAKGVTLYRDGSRSKQVLNRGITLPTLGDIPCKVCSD